MRNRKRRHKNYCTAATIALHLRDHPTDETTFMSSKDYLKVVDAILSYMADELLRGATVDLGSIGTIELVDKGPKKVYDFSSRLTYEKKHVYDLKLKLYPYFKKRIKRAADERNGED